MEGETATSTIPDLKTASMSELITYTSKNYEIMLSLKFINSFLTVEGWPDTGKYLVSDDEHWRFCSDIAEVIELIRIRGPIVSKVYEDVSM